MMDRLASLFKDGLELCHDHQFGALGFGERFEHGFDLRLVDFLRSLWRGDACGTLTDNF